MTWHIAVHTSSLSHLKEGTFLLSWRIESKQGHLGLPTILELLEVHFAGRNTKGKDRYRWLSTFLSLCSLLSDEMAPKRNLLFKRGKSRVDPREGKLGEDGLSSCFTFKWEKWACFFSLPSTLAEVSRVISTLKQRAHNTHVRPGFSMNPVVSPWGTQILQPGLPGQENWWEFGSETLVIKKECVFLVFYI